MKTLSQVRAEAQQRRSDRKAEHERLIQNYLARAEEWLDTDPPENALRIREAVRHGGAEPLGIACDHCGFELAGTKTFGVLSYPPSRRVHCPACGASDTQSIDDQLDE